MGGGGGIVLAEVLGRLVVFLVPFRGRGCWPLAKMCFYLAIEGQGARA